MSLARRGESRACAQRRALVHRLPANIGGEHRACRECRARARVMMSRSSTTKSANLPGGERAHRRLLEAGVRRPDRHALQRLLARHALLRHTSRPPASSRRPAATRRVEAEQRIHRLHREVAAVGDDDAGVRAASATRTRRAAGRAPRRLPAQYMSLVWCTACIDGITPSCAKRGMSSWLRICACSTRKRWSAVGIALERRLVRVEHDAVAAVADGVRVHLEAGARARARRRPGCAPGAETSRPLLFGSSLYGSSSAAPREPSAPSA